MKDTAKTAAARRAARPAIAQRPEAGEPLGTAVALPLLLACRCIDEAGGDRLDAVVCGVQAAWSARRTGDGYGLPRDIDPLEGWIA